MALQQFQDLNALQQNLAQQVASGGINQAQADAELARVRQLNLDEVSKFFAPQIQSGALTQQQADAELARLGGLDFQSFANLTTPDKAIEIPQVDPAPAPAPTIIPPTTVNTAPAPSPSTVSQQTEGPPPGAITDLSGIRANLQQQVASGAISQAAADAEFNRISGIIAGGGFVDASGNLLPGTSAGPAHSIPLFQAVGNIGSEPKIQAAFQQALGLTGLGTPTFPPEAGFFPTGSLGRVSEVPSTQIEELLARFNEQSKELGEVPGLQNIQRSLFSEFSKISPNELRAIAARRAGVASAGRVDPNLLAALEQRRSQLSGLSAPQLQGLRELGEKGIDARQQQLLSQARLGNIAAGRRGLVEAAALPAIAREALDAQGLLEKRLIETDLGERERQLQGFTGLASQIDRDRFAKQQAANQGFENAIQNILGRRFGQGTTALQNIIGTNQAQQQLSQQALRDFATATGQFERDLFERQRLNLDRLAAEKQGQLGLLFGLPSFIAQQLANERAFTLGARELDILKAQLKADEEQFKLLIETLGNTAGGGGGGGFRPPNVTNQTNPATGLPVTITD